MAHLFSLSQKLSLVLAFISTASHTGQICIFRRLFPAVSRKEKSQDEHVAKLPSMQAILERVRRCWQNRH